MIYSSACLVIYIIRILYLCFLPIYVYTQRYYIDIGIHRKRNDRFIAGQAVHFRRYQIISRFMLFLSISALLKNIII